MNKNKTFSFEAKQNSIDFLYDDDDILIASIDLFHTDENDECNRNRCRITKEAALKSQKTFFNKPIICRFNSICKDLVTDVTEHARNSKETFEMRVAGHIPSDSRIKFIERDNGKTYCNAEAVIQKKYLPELVTILHRNDGKIKVSIEIMAKGKKDEDGIFIIDEFVLQGICLLGESVMEGIEGSRLEVLKFSKEEIDIMNEKYIKFSSGKNEYNKENKAQNVFDEIKQKIQEDSLIMNSIGINELQSKLWTYISKFKYRPKDSNYDYDKYYVEEIYPDEKFIIVRDNELQIFLKINYEINNSKLNIDINKSVEVEKAWHERPLNEKRFSIIFSKEEYGTGPTIKVDKSKDSVSDKEWGEVDKTELRKKVLNAKNYKSLVYDVYAEVEENWEDSPSSKLKYPIMLIEDNVAVYARYGLSSALGYAKAENNTSVIDKVEKLYETLKINEKEEKMENDKELQNAVETEPTESENVSAEEVTNTQEEVITNSEEPTPESDNPSPVEEDVKNDWEQKFKELEEKYSSMEQDYSACLEQLNVYKQKEDKESMKAYLHSYRKCFNEDELQVMASKIENSQRLDFEKEVDEKVKEFVRKMAECEDSDDDIDEKDIDNSFVNMPNPSLSDEPFRKRTLDDVHEDLTK